MAKGPSERERYDENTHSFYEESVELALDKYLETILPQNSDLFHAMQKITTVGQALLFQEALENLLLLSGQSQMKTLIEALYPAEPHIASRNPIPVEERRSIELALRQNSSERSTIDPILQSVKHNDDKLLIIDLCRLLADTEQFSPEIFESVSALSLAAYRILNQSFSIVQGHLQSHARAQFHKEDFQTWRNEHFKQYLKAKRKEEKEQKRYAKPYTDYLDQIEKQLFKKFWEENRLRLIHDFLLGSSENQRKSKNACRQIERRHCCSFHRETVEISSIDALV